MYTAYTLYIQTKRMALQYHPLFGFIIGLSKTSSDFQPIMP
jgi:hypothetical protein